MPYIDRNGAGNITGIYTCQQHEGQEFAEAAELYVFPPTPLEQIRTLEERYADDQAKLTRQSLLTMALDKACALPEAAGLTRDQVHVLLLTKSNGYAALYNLEQQIAALRAQF